MSYPTWCLQGSNKLEPAGQQKLSQTTSGRTRTQLFGQNELTTCGVTGLSRAGARDPFVARTTATANSLMDHPLPDGWPACVPVARFDFGLVCVLCLVTHKCMRIRENTRTWALYLPPWQHTAPIALDGGYPRAEFSPSAWLWLSSLSVCIGIHALSCRMSIM